ncbi:hypothetical protein A3709_20290 [Halioglobus sp. HI00S01]|nr:hypothetical protein A3709_20290 [Halioglobus sp. HI00S01]
MSNTLTYIRDTYAGPWPKVLRNSAFLFWMEHMLSVMTSPADLLSPSSLMQSFLLVGGLVVFALWLKKRYPPTT